MRLDLIAASASRGLFEASGGQIPLFDVPRQAPCEAAADEAVCRMRHDVQAAEVAELYAVWRSEVSERAWGIISRSEMGWSLQGETVRLVRDGVCLFEGTADDVFEVVREQARMGQPLVNRVDRLRACGNGVVPLAAAVAWLSLDALLAEARRADEPTVRAAA